MQVDELVNCDVVLDRRDDELTNRQPGGLTSVASLVIVVLVLSCEQTHKQTDSDERLTPTIFVSVT